MTKTGLEFRITAIDFAPQPLLRAELYPLRSADLAGRRSLGTKAMQPELRTGKMSAAMGNEELRIKGVPLTR